VTGDYDYACQLVEQVRAHDAGFSVGVAAHPEVHPRSPDRESDRRHLAAKLELADFAMTQFFFTVDVYERLVEELAALGCDKPVVPGVMPIASVAGVRRMAAMNGTAIPDALQARLDAADGDPEAVRKIGVEVAIDLSQQLVAAGAPGLHLYALNRSESVREVVAALG
jgi:methylenetetrahydrofolate reductase (NADPH)